MKVKPCAHEVVEVVVITFSQSLTLAKYSTSLASSLKLASEMFGIRIYKYFFSFFEQLWTRSGPLTVRNPKLVEKNKVEKFDFLVQKYGIQYHQI